MADRTSRPDDNRRRPRSNTFDDAINCNAVLTDNVRGVATWTRIRAFLGTDRVALADLVPELLKIGTSS